MCCIKYLHISLNLLAMKKHLINYNYQNYELRKNGKYDHAI